MKQLKLILMAIPALFVWLFALPTPAARRGNNKRGGFNFLRALCMVFFSAIIGGAAFAEGFRLSGEGCKYLVNGQWKPCSAQQSPANVNPKAEVTELEKAGAKTAEDAQRAAQQAEIAARQAEMTAQQARWAADAAKRAADAAKERANAARQAISATRKAGRARAKGVYDQCAAGARGNSTALSNCARLKGQAVKAASDAETAARKAALAAKKAAHAAKRDAKKAEKAAKKAETAAKKAAALARVERDYAACVVAANGDATAIAACHKSRKSAMKAAR